MSRTASSGIFFLLLSSVLGVGLAAEGTASAQVGASASKDDPRITRSPGFISARRDLYHREQGIRHLNDGQYAAAAEAFRTAARYADKLSQAAHAEMLWEGRGVAQDRPLAYAWMDLAAERCSSALLAKREEYWQALSEAERTRAVEVGQAVYAEYGDEVAQPRQERVMQRARRGATGSRVGAATGNLRIIPASEIMGNDWAQSIQGMSGISGDRYYSDAYWEPENHWQRQDEEIERGLTPRVRVGDVEQYKREPDARAPRRPPSP